MKRIVINSCYGGFSVSVDALYLLLRMGFPLDKHPLDGSGYNPDDFELTGPDGVRATRHGRVLLQGDYIYSLDIYAGSAKREALRSHPVLVKVVEMLGQRANGPCANLTIEELDSDALYRIEEYDGMESVYPLSTENYTAGFDYVEPVLPPDMQLAGKLQLLTGPEDSN